MDKKKRQMYMHEHYLRNKKEKNEYQREWRKNNPSKEAEYRKKVPQAIKAAYKRKYLAKHKARVTEQRRWLRLKKYGMTKSIFNTLLLLQNNACAICCAPFTTAKRPCVDHCHTTGRYRGLLCSACNVAEGHLLKPGVDPLTFARSLVAYLTSPPARSAELV